MIEPKDIRRAPSLLGPEWCALFSVPVTFGPNDFLNAMDNIVRNPNINSTVLLRSDIYLEHTHGMTHYMSACNTQLDPSWQQENINDLSPRLWQIQGFDIDAYIVRRNIPRNPVRDPVTNQTCAFYTSGAQDGSQLVVYIPHLAAPSKCPFYLPRAAAVALCYTQNIVPSCSVHFSLFDGDPLLTDRDDSDRLIRTGLHLLNTCVKHSKGRAAGYQKRVQHDVIIPRSSYQDRYLQLKQKYAELHLNTWAEKTDPRKHVFEDLGIAAFLIELWAKLYRSKSSFTFKDLGCGNGFLVYILICEGYRGFGYDARARKSWKTYPNEVQSCLKECILVPSILKGNCDLTHADNIIIEWVGDDDRQTFLIGNHSDELTLWIPLFGNPYFVLPCCSYDLNGKPVRFVKKGGSAQSTYSALVNKTLEVSRARGWHPELEMLRIPSTRNAAIVGWQKNEERDTHELIKELGGCAGWLHAASSLKSTSRNH